MANLAASSSPGYAKFKKAQKLLAKYNSGDYKWMMDKDKERVASIAAQYGLDFKADSKPVRKALFDFADMATFGLVPDKWRPTTIGEEYGFESGMDKVAGAAGSLGGIFTPYGGPSLLMKGAGKASRGIKNWWKGGAGGVSAEGAAGNKIAQLNQGRDTALLGQGAPRLGQGTPQLGIDPRGGYLNRTFPGYGKRPNLLGMPGGNPAGGFNKYGEPLINRTAWQKSNKYGEPLIQRTPWYNEAYR